MSHAYRCYRKTIKRGKRLAAMANQFMAGDRTGITLPLVKALLSGLDNLPPNSTDELMKHIAPMLSVLDNERTEALAGMGLTPGATDVQIAHACIANQVPLRTFFSLTYARHLGTTLAFQDKEETCLQ